MTKRWVLRQQAWDYLMDAALPRRKYAPNHWYVSVYFAGVRAGTTLLHASRPFRLFWRGLKDAIECD